MSSLYNEEGRDLREELSLESVLNGHEAECLTKFKARQEPFLTLEAEGWKKYQAVCRWLSGTVAVHFWEKDGRRIHLKVAESMLDQGVLPCK